MLLPRLWVTNTGIYSAMWMSGMAWHDGLPTPHRGLHGVKRCVARCGGWRKEIWGKMGRGDPGMVYLTMSKMRGGEDNENGVWCLGLASVAEVILD